MSSKTILLVEDDADIRDALKNTLEFEGFTVIEAENGQHALDLLQDDMVRSSIGLVILDLMMPVMNGTQFIEKVQSMNPPFGAPIVVATARTSGANIPEHFRSIRKPYDIPELLKIVHKSLK